MQALILAGGEGTRLRPLTMTVAKPVVPLANRPFITYMIDWLQRHGFDDIVLSCGFLADGVRDVLGTGDLNGVAVQYVDEPQPLGTAGAVKLAEPVLGDRFAVLNGDVLTDLDISRLRDFHEQRGALATLGLYPVEDPSSYGVVVTDEEGRVQEFVEKPAPGTAPSNHINAGIYMLEHGVLDHIDSGRAVSFEREVFPTLVGRGLLGWQAEGYWVDIGTPDRYLEATYDLLGGYPASGLPARDETSSLIGEGCLTAGAHIGPQTVLGAHCSVGSDTAVERSVLHDGVLVGPDCVIRESVLAEAVHVGEGAHVEPGALVGAGARVEPGARVEAGARVEPGETVG